MMLWQIKYNCKTITYNKYQISEGRTRHFPTLKVLYKVLFKHLYFWKGLYLASLNRINKFQLKSNPKIVLPKVDLHQYRPFWAHRAFQMRRCSQVNVDMTLKSFENRRKTSMISIGNETEVWKLAEIHFSYKLVGFCTIVEFCNVITLSTSCKI